MLKTYTRHKHMIQVLLLNKSWYCNIKTQKENLVLSQILDIQTRLSIQISKAITPALLTSLLPGAYLKIKFLGSDACAWTMFPPSELLSQGWSFTMYVHFASNSASGQSVISTPSMSIFMVCYVPSGRGDSILGILLCCVAAWNTEK